MNQALQKDGNAEVLNAPNDSLEDISECHYKHQKTRPKSVYYDEVNSHSLKGNTSLLVSQSQLNQ